jgi:PhnB protein
MTQINAYLRFNGNCREAMTFYQQCLGGELKMQSVGESPAAQQMPPEAHKNIMHSVLTNDKMVLLASDMMATGDRVTGNAVALIIQCSTEKEINTFFANLSAGGKVIYPLHTEFWGDTFGILIDKYGYEWMMNFEKPNTQPL